jgi:negative regulator of sigma E activity
VVLSLAVSVYVQPAVRVTVPFEVLAAVIAEIRDGVSHDVAASAGDETATLPVAAAMSTAAPADTRRTHVMRNRPRVLRAPAPTLLMPRSGRLLLRARTRCDHLRTICSSPIPHPVTNGA